MKCMEMVLHRAASRRHLDHGWLKSYHTFSFAGYNDPQRMHFGMLRVLNDEIVKGGAGFREHAHDNMEIVSIPLAGSLEHKDTMGNRSVVTTNDIQIMSAGSGLRHSINNYSTHEKVNFLQIWIYPKEKNIAPRYARKSFDPNDLRNKIQPVVSPGHSEGTIRINQDAYFSMGRFERGFKAKYEMHASQNGVYIFVLEGSVKALKEALLERDGMGVWKTRKVPVEAITEAALLFIEVPMTA